MAISSGTRLGPYEVMAAVGAGGMGEVYPPATGGDGEPLYFVAENLSLIGRRDDAVNFLRESIRRNYCGSIAMDNDPLLANVRSMPEYKELHAGAVACHEKFLRER